MARSRPALRWLAPAVVMASSALACVDIQPLSYSRIFDGSAADAGGEAGPRDAGPIDRDAQAARDGLAPRGDGSPTPGPDGDIDGGFLTDAFGRRDAMPDQSSDDGMLPSVEMRCDGESEPPCNGCRGIVVSPGWVCAPAGRMLMGSPPEEPGRSPGGERQREVCFGAPLLVMVEEVDQDEWQWQMEENPSVAAVDPAHPVESISWRDALVFANRKSLTDRLDACYLGDDLAPYTRRHAVEGQIPAAPDADCLGYRLPTEAEWAWLARAGGQHAGMAYGDLERVARFAGEATARSGSGEPNAWGIRDVLGNVWEMTWDPWIEAPPDPDGCDAVADGAHDDITLRGCGWRSEADACRLAHRAALAVDEVRADTGLRLVRRPP